MLAACVDDLEAFALVGGALAPDRVEAIVVHADECHACHELIEGLCATESLDEGVERDALIGVVIDGYRVDSLIAAGGMGVVYRATTCGREVALKMPRWQAPVLMRRFEREVAITMCLAGQGIVPILATGGLPDGTPYYVMPVIDGVSLDVAIDRAVNRAQRRALLPHLVAVARTMARAHELRIAHRDLKPQNVLLAADGDTFVIDWGLAKDRVQRARRASVSSPNAPTTSIARVLAGRTTRPGDVFGTPAFMAPEQARGEPADERADVYAIGAMLEHLLTGRLPRKAAAAALAQAPAELVAICHRATAVESADRYANCGELAAALTDAMRGRSS